MQLLTSIRVEKYRPNSLDDVEGHKDIITTINKFVDSNVRTLDSIKITSLT
jgi:DNA polymerase III gamma/tau subunit